MATVLKSPDTPEPWRSTACPSGTGISPLGLLCLNAMDYEEKCVLETHLQTMLISVPIQSAVVLQPPPSARLPGCEAEEPTWGLAWESGGRQVWVPASTGPSSCSRAGCSHTVPIHSGSWRGSRTGTRSWKKGQLQPWLMVED